MLGRRELGDATSALTFAQPAKLGGAVFGDDHIDVAARGRYPGDARDDPGCTPATGAGKRDDRPAPRRADCRSKEVHRPADAAQVPAVENLRVHLAPEIDL